MIYHITTGSAWTEAQKRGSYHAASLDSEGFIHCSTRDQLLYVADGFYRGEADLFVLCIDPSRLNAELRWEAPAHPQPTGTDATLVETLFPHLYGPLNLDAVVAVHALSEGASGFAWPRGIP